MSSKDPKDYNEQVVKQAYEVWTVMHGEARKRGLARDRHKPLGDGRVILGTVASFIKGLSETRSWNLDKDGIDLVRGYLKSTGNVVVLEKIADFQFRIFVKEEWSNAKLVTKPVSNTRIGPTNEEKLTPHDAGEDRKPAPVEVKHACTEPDCDAVFDTPTSLNAHKGTHTRKRGQHYVTKLHKKILGGLARQGGIISDKHGRVANKVARLCELENPGQYTTSSKLLEERGYITRDIRGKRTYKIALTDEGWKLGRQYAGGMTKRQELEAEAAAEEAQPQPDLKARSLASKAQDPIEVEPEPEPKVRPITLDALETQLGGLVYRVCELRRQTADTSELDNLKERLQLVKSLLKEAEAGQLSPLKALSEIQEAVNL